MSDPLLTIFIPAYNAARYLSLTLDSLLSQSFGDFEVIIVDDGSSDRTVPIAQAYAENDQRVRLIRSPHRGEVAARNKALACAHPHSRYFLNHDSDDLSLPGKLEKLVRYLDSHPEIAIAGTLAEYFNDAGQDLCRPDLETSPERIRATFQTVNSMINSASMIRRQVFEAVGGYREEFRSVDDYDFFMRALLSGARLANLAEVLHRIRIHPDSVGSRRAAEQQRLAKQVQELYLEHRDTPEPTVIRVPLMLSKLYRPAKSSRRLRILHTVQMYHPHVGGSEEVVKQISERLVQRGHHVTVATGRHPDRDFTQWHGVEVRQFDISGNAVHGVSGDVDAYRQFLLKSDFDVTVNYAAQIWSSDLVFPLLDRLRAGRVFIPCGYSGLLMPAFREYFERMPAILEKYDRVVHLSENYRDAQFSRQHGLRNSMVIGNAAAVEEFMHSSGGFREKYGIRTPLFAITVANHYEGKGHRNLLRWFKELRRHDVTLAIIGNRTAGGCWEDCVQAARSIPNIRLYEDLPRVDVVGAFKDADLFWFGSEVECFPLVILEAMASQTPWLSLNVGNVEELAGGWVADPGQMVEKAAALLDSPDLRTELASQGFEEWKAKYTWQRIVDQYEAMYLEVARNRETVTCDPLRSRPFQGESSLPAGLGQSDRKGTLSPWKGESASVFRERRGSERDVPQNPGLVSVVIPCYKQAHYLPEAVESVLQQTYKQFEIIIVDDGSPDNTKETARALIEKYSSHPIRLISHSNRGLATSRNVGIGAARGEYVLPLDADDKIKPAFLQACVDKMTRDGGISIVAVNLEEFGDSHRKISCGDPVLARIAIENQINYCSLFRKSLWEKVGGYRPSMRWGFEDWDFWISCLESGARVAVVRAHLFLYRKRGESMYSSALDHGAELQAQIALNHPGLYSAETEEWARALVQVRDRAAGGADELKLHGILSKYYATHARWHEALPHLTKLAESAAASPDLVFLLAVAWLRMKSFAKGFRALRAFLDIHPDQAQAQFLAAVATACLGDLRSAAEYAENAVELDLKMTAGYELLIALSRAEQDSTSAADFAARCAELRIQPSPWVFSDQVTGLHRADGWVDTVYPKYLAFAPQPLLELRSDRQSTSNGVPSARIEVGAETKVSVIMPTFNRPGMLASAIDSVLGQTMQNFEILVVNDAGVDVEAVVSGKNGSGKIAYVRHGRNLGLAAARNTGIKLARGSYIAYLDDDDIYYPEHLQTLVHCLENNDCRVAYTDARRVHQVEQGGALVVTHRDLPYSVDFDHDHILVGNFIPVLCVMHRKSCLEEAGLFDESLTSHEDWDLWIRMSRKNRFGHIRKATCEFSWRTDGSSMTSRKQRDFLRTIELIYEKTRQYADARPHVSAARLRYLQDKKSLILAAQSPDIPAGRVSVSAG